MPGHKLSREDIGAVTDIAARVARESVNGAGRGEGGLTIPTTVIRPATVTAGGPQGTEVAIVIDGDTMPITALNVCGQGLLTGTRCLVTFVPPHGIFITNTFAGGDSRAIVGADYAAISTTTLQSINELAFEIKADRFYTYRFGLVYSISASPGGLKLSVTYPAAEIETARASIGGYWNDGDVAWYFGSITASGDAVTSDDALNLVYLAVIEGCISPTVDGTLQAQYAANGSGTTTLYAGSFGILTTF